MLCVWTWPYSSLIIVEKNMSHDNLQLLRNFHRKCAVATHCCYDGYILFVWNYKRNYWYAYEQTCNQKLIEWWWLVVVSNSGTVHVWWGKLFCDLEFCGWGTMRKFTFRLQTSFLCNFLPKLWKFLTYSYSGHLKFVS